ncbi:MAG: RidA family protein [Rhizobiaceae bacterium]
MKALSCDKIHPPFGHYSQGTEIPAGWRVVKTSGQLGIMLDGTIPEDAYSQACVCFESISRILAKATMSAGDVAHISAYVTDREHFGDYMRARDEFMGGVDRLPGSTLLIVSGFTRSEFKVEVEVTAAAP